MNSESFAEFKNSFSYGPRNDLNFKFLKALSDEQAAAFFRELLWKLGETINDGDASRLIEHVVAGQTAGYGTPTTWEYEDGPFAPLRVPLSAARVGLISSTGHFVNGQDPEPFGVKDMTQEEAVARINEFLRAAPELSPIPLDTPAGELRARHGGYDVRGVLTDHNVALPLDPLRALAADGTIGTAHSPAFSFVGAAAQTPLIKRTGPEWVRRFQDAAIDAVILVPV